MKQRKFKYLALIVLLLVALSACTKSGTTDLDFSSGLTDEGFFLDIKASDYVTLPAYKDILIPEEVLIPEAEALAAEIEAILDEYTTYAEITSGKVEDGDTVNIDYVGSVDGVDFDGGSTEGMGTEVTIGVTQYIDDFLEQLIGHSPGQTFDIEVTFPDPYSSNEDLSGKDAVFKVTINYIQGEPETVALSDEIASDLGHDSKESLIEAIEEWLVSQQKWNFFNELMEEATAKNIPASVIDYVKKLDTLDLKKHAEQYDMDVEEFLEASQSGYSSLEDYLAKQSEFHTKAATRYLAIQAIAEIEGLLVSEEDMTKAGYDQHVDDYGSPYLKFLLLETMVVPDFVLGKAS